MTLSTGFTVATGVAFGDGDGVTTGVAVADGVGLGDGSTDGAGVAPELPSEAV
jgi:hypothetical protein